MRIFDARAFDTAYHDVVMAGSWQESTDYYPRYRSRYEAVLRVFARMSRDEPVDLLEIGGGQLAALATRMWKDRSTVGDLTDTCFPTLRAEGVDTFVCNLAKNDLPAGASFDVILLSEVIEHLPVPGHIALRRLRGALRPGGFLVCTTPNLYRLRNVVFLALGRPIFDHFDEPGDAGSGHVLEYSAEHLYWQFEQAGFTDIQLSLQEFAHSPNRRSDRVLSWLGKPLLHLPRFRDNLLVTAVAP
jgi:SAM-dependent methyltransferase